MPIWLKYAITAGIVVLVSELARKSDRLGAFIAALPFVTTLVMIWLFVEKQGNEKIGSHSFYTFWYVIPTLPMFLLIPALLRRGWHFYAALGSGLVLTLVCFGLLGIVLKRFGVELW